MLDPKTLYVTSVVMTAMMTLLNYLTWRANKDTPGTVLYIFYPMVLFAGIIGFALHSHFQQWQSIGVANGLLFAASMLHCWAISQFLGVRDKAFQFYLIVTGILFCALVYFSAVAPGLRQRILISDLQHIAEALLLLYYFIRYAHPLYPNGSIVYLIVLSFILCVFTGRTLLMGEINHANLLDSPWFTITLFFNGVLAPIFYATGMAILCNERREHNLNRLTEKAQQDLEIRGLFLSTVSHEIRTPLNGILGSAQLVLNRIGDQASKAYCEAIINSAESLNLLIDKVLDYASLEQSDEVLAAEDIEFKSWLNNLCLLMTPMAEQRGLTFTLVYDMPEQVCYYCDQQKLRQILLNLVGNAIKFTDQGEVKICVELIKEGNMEHRVRFSVIDTGPGIEEEDIEKLTEPYVQSSAGKTKGGTGLGLAITARLLDKMGSQLEIISELDKGSSFSFDLTLTVGELSLVEKRHHNVDYATGLDVLLVEDLDLNRKIAIEFMAIDEHRIKLANDGQSAIEQLTEHAFDVVLLDMNLPDLTGQEVLKRLKNIEHKNRRTPFLAFTASLSPEEIKEYLALGIRDVVGKPIKQDKLRQAISNSQKAQTPDISVELSDTLYDESAVTSLSGFSEDEVSSIYNEFVLSARTKLRHIQQLLDEDDQQCIKLLHRQASTALQLGFNRYGLTLKKIERRLLDKKRCDEELADAMVLWQQSLEAYLQYVRHQTVG
ncbi:ATP-binding protein [Pseudoalteromonas rubra]|uniref:histidine kinase n=1 Tax=Pseudoalteromonas rubra TaxID=43658 RepID=A0A4Q7DZX3_9GAMM|nr:ATP-binding protein [Pseudoalteromonas rubra]RZM75122.1 hybrid sensor histidine kinase/response regulator [Pseudoalteromonas rubra]